VQWLPFVPDLVSAAWVPGTDGYGGESLRPGCGYTVGNCAEYPTHCGHGGRRRGMAGALGGCGFRAIWLRLRQLRRRGLEELKIRVSEDGIYFTPGPDPKGGYSIQFLNSSAGIIERVASIEKPVGFGLAVSPDRRRILYAQVDTAGSDLMLLENFR